MTGPQIGGAFGRVANDEGFRFCFELAEQFIIDRLFHDHA